MLFIVEPVTRERWLKQTEQSEEWTREPAKTRPNPFLPGETITVRRHPTSTHRVLSHGKFHASAELSSDDDQPNVLVVHTDAPAAAAYIATLFDASCAQLK